MKFDWSILDVPQFFWLISIHFSAELTFNRLEAHDRCGKPMGPMDFELENDPQMGKVHIYVPSGNLTYIAIENGYL